MADLLRNGFIWTPFCPDLDQAIFEPDKNPFVPFLFVANGPLGHASDGTLEAGKRRKHLFYRAKLFTGAENTRFVVPGSPQCFKVHAGKAGQAVQAGQAGQAGRAERLREALLTLKLLYS